jgi:hypothetical protein
MPIKICPNHCQHILELDFASSIFLKYGLQTLIRSNDDTNFETCLSCYRLKWLYPAAQNKFPPLHIEQHIVAASSWQTCRALNC